MWRSALRLDVICCNSAARRASPAEIAGVVLTRGVLGVELVVELVLGGSARVFLLMFVLVLGGFRQSHWYSI